MILQYERAKKAKPDARYCTVVSDGGFLLHAYFYPQKMSQFWRMFVKQSNPLIMFIWFTSSSY